MWIGQKRWQLFDWLDWMGLHDAGTFAVLDRYIGYFEAYATSHEALDRDLAVPVETRKVARSVATAVAGLRAAQLQPAKPTLSRPRPK
jgi:hypothetical protein